MIIAGFDIGGTNTKGVILDGEKIISKELIPGNSNFIVKECMSNILEKSGIREEDVNKICITGGLARKIERDTFKKEFSRIDEIKSLGTGGMHLSKKKNLFVASIGTGTAFLTINDGDIKHIGGSGIGGGTIKGLTELILDSSVDDAEMMASLGKRQNIDMTVFDIVGGDLCNIPANATASNFGKMTGEQNSKDVASSLLNMIAESIGVMSYFAAKSNNLENDILVCGRVVLNTFIKVRMIETIELFGGKVNIPENAEYCGAIGAALLAE